jgi:DnaJ homolog subfamily A member 2
MKCFEVLGLAPMATPDEVKQAWRRLAGVHHPDRGGDPSEFDRLRKLYGEALAVAEAPKTCTKCGGSGKIRRVNGWASIDIPCDHCGGSGEEP